MIRSLRVRTGTEGDEATLADLIEAFIDRRRAGEALDPSAFAAEHPEHAEALRDLIPTLAVMDELARTACREPEPADAGRPSSPEGDRLGDFRILRVIGRGGMAVVYEAEQVSLGRRVALKVLPWAGRPDDRQLARFRVEAYAVAALNHPHIVPLFATRIRARGALSRDEPMIAGRSLAQVIVERRDDGEGGLVAAEGGAGPPGGRRRSNTAPRHGILHLVTSTGQPPGRPRRPPLGRRFRPGAGPGPRRADRQRGRPRHPASYTSPEQAAGRRLLDQRTDIYAIGATLYELLTLRPAFDGHDRHVLLRQIADDEPIPLRRLVPAIPRDLETIVLKAMAREPQARYESARTSPMTCGASSPIGPSGPGAANLSRRFGPMGRGIGPP